MAIVADIIYLLFVLFCVVVRDEDVRDLVVIEVRDLRVERSEGVRVEREREADHQAGSVTGNTPTNTTTNTSITTLILLSNKSILSHISHACTYSVFYLTLL